MYNLSLRIRQDTSLEAGEGHIRLDLIPETSCLISFK